MLGGVIFLVTWDIPAPTSQVETVIPDERLPALRPVDAQRRRAASLTSA